MPRRLDVAIDVGGDFVDLVAHGADQPTILLKRPRDPEAALGATVAALLAQAGIAPAEVARLRLATTLATNALVNGTAGPVALVATRGFADVPDLGRQSKRDPMDEAPPPPTPHWLSPPDLRCEIGGRIDARGEEVEPLEGLDAVLAHLARLPPGASAAICLLFAPLNPAHELAVAQAIAAARPDLRLSLSHQVDPGPREFERTLATLADAALKPLAAARLSGLTPAPWVLRAEGGLAPLAEALDHPLGLALSGPAAGARAVAFWAQGENAIGLDMGGTTTEVSLVRAGQPLTAREIGLGALRLRCPALDVESLAMGGGTTLALQEGRLRFGPAARPAGRGGAQATLTDAALCAGWLPGAAPGLALDRAAAAAALVAALGTAEAAPALELAEAVIANALRRIALRRGLDPTRALLVAGGGAGPLHAAAIAQRIGARRVLLPPTPGLLSAFGVALAPAAASLEASCDLALEYVAQLAPQAAAQAAALTARLAAWGCTARPAHSLAMAYGGQAETLAVPFQPGEAPQDLATRFDALHAATRGHDPGGARRMLALRCVAEAPLGPPPPPPSPGTLAHRTLPDGTQLRDGADATLRIPPGWQAMPRADGALLLERAA
ncbi:hydantoinase/oxoprolinase family protein [Falsiroseomonas tokyonensis]|uniref:Hydantoinase/oxoprolinase family protein n=1 Tax=Falsiroseomonas tokyonensis TaxID=430521 RepID=A0ABV7BXL4_9PROT|nr:hydantoinase/oxoprolinase family protein [Falsiroseomonas tokyonensis]MBU8539384.1 hydantoinase/oxoprolinase family protein [Falsiroseomonas tokyonensis]